MIDIVLMQHFLNAVPSNCRLVLVGDSDQLPAVGAGSVLKDILRSQTVPYVKLEVIFRQLEESLIVKNAHAINAGRKPNNLKGRDFVFLPINDEEEVANKIIELAQLEIKENCSMLDVQVLAPMHRQVCGVSNLNKLLQENFNPASADKAEYVTTLQTLRAGDKVMQIKNNYEKNVFNGDIGFISYIDVDRIIVEFSGRDVTYLPKEYGELTLAYAMSVHKSQGSEYKVVILPLVRSHFIMLQRNLLYTAITRAKEKVILIGDEKALYTAISNNRMQKRYTLLAERLTHQL